MNQQRLLGEQVEPFYFGPERSLFGIYHLPPPGAVRDYAVVLCPSIEQEAIRGHRAYRQMAIRLSRLGYPTVRFDYHGTGDSKGEEPAAALSQWLDDLTSAIAEVRRRSQKQWICLAGLRMGAALAVLASQTAVIDGLALWEPVIRGSTYVEELVAWHQDKLLYFLSDAPAQASGTPSAELLGQPMQPSLMNDLTKLDLLAIRQRPSSQMMIVEHEPQPEVEDFITALKQWDVDVQHQVVADPRVWSDDPDKALVPNRVLQTFVSWFSERFV